MKRIPIILDVDTGIDDAMAIALATRSDSCELVAVTTVAGNTTIENATRNSLDVLDMMGRSDVPVHRGASRPLARPLQQAAHVHGNNGIGGALLPESEQGSRGGSWPGGNDSVGERASWRNHTGLRGTTHEPRHCSQC